eukprot:m.356133 g.356133  ORF g.356133 m.356133 type:complete len:71 (+) comp17448_c0_seq1:147-359(+)
MFTQGVNISDAEYYDVYCASFKFARHTPPYARISLSTDEMKEVSTQRPQAKLPKLSLILSWSIHHHRKRH